jgi:hypothetical protein
MLKIESDGTPTGSILSVDGQPITGHVAKVVWQHRGPDVMPEAVVELVFSQVTLATKRVIYRDGQGRRIKRIEFENVTLQSSDDAERTG